MNYVILRSLKHGNLFVAPNDENVELNSFGERAYEIVAEEPTEALALETMNKIDSK